MDGKDRHNTRAIFEFGRTLENINRSVRKTAMICAHMHALCSSMLVCIYALHT